MMLFVFTIKLGELKLEAGKGRNIDGLGKGLGISIPNEFNMCSNLSSEVREAIVQLKLTSKKAIV